MQALSIRTFSFIIHEHSSLAAFPQPLCFFFYYIYNFLLKVTRSSFSTMLVKRVWIFFFAVEILFLLFRPQLDLIGTRDHLIELKPGGTATRPREIPEETWRRTHRGSRGGNKQWRREIRKKHQRFMEKRSYKPFLPSVTMGNVRSLVNKMEVLTAPAKHQRVLGG